MNHSLDRQHFRCLDKEDPLAGFRERFCMPDEVIYLDGNSLGPLPRSAPGRAAELIEKEWGEGLIRSWNTHGWVNLPTRLGDKLAPLIGADNGEVLVCDSTSVNLFKLAAAALGLAPGRQTIISEQGNFPTDLYMLEGLESFSASPARLRTESRENLLQAIDGDTALVVLTHVHYKTGALWDLAEVTRRAHGRGALVLWDLSHSTGALPVDLNQAGADFAVGCGYKYLNGGPGAPAYLFVARRHHGQLDNPLSGWFGHAEPFRFEERYRPATGVGRMQCGTPPVIAAALLETGMDVVLSADMRQLRRKSMALGQHFIDLVAAHCPEFRLASPPRPELRGSQVSFHHEQGYAIVQALIERGVIGDFREPDILRFGLAPLYTRYIDVHDAVMALAEVMVSRAWDQPRFQRRAAVT
jgi:kynureninase